MFTKAGLKEVEKYRIKRLPSLSERFDFYPDLQQYLTRGPCYAAVLERVDGIQGWRCPVKPTDPTIARRVAAYSIRAKIGSSMQENDIHASAERTLRTVSSSPRLLKLTVRIFPQRYGQSA